MSAKPSIGSFKIISLTEGKPPASINATFLPTLPVRLNETIQLWRIRELREVDENTYIVRLAVGGHNFTGVDGNVVTAYTRPEQDIEWIVTYREYNKAYTFAPVDNPSEGWTVPPDLSSNPVIEIKPITATFSIPPQYLATQLWHFIIPVEE